MPARSPGLRDYRRALLGKIKIPTLVPPKNGGTRIGHPAGETRALRQSDAARESQNPHRVPPKNGGTKDGVPDAYLGGAPGATKQNYRWDRMHVAGFQ